jgi:hypothetical protein
MQLHLRPFHQRFWNSYRGWRRYLPIAASLHAAWRVARAGSRK